MLKSIQETPRDKLHTFFANNSYYFQGLSEDKVKDIMINVALKELLIHPEEIYDYVDDFDIAFFSKRVYN